MMPTVPMFGLEIATASFAEATAALVQAMEQNAPAKVVVTPNTDQIVKLHNNPDLLRQYRTADFILPDGFPLVAASRLLHGRKGCLQRVTGADLFPALCQAVAKRNGRIFLLGGRPEHQGLLRELMARKYPAAACEVFSPSMNFLADSDEGHDAADRVNQFKPDLTFACLGMPKQERWALQFRPTLATKLVCCFGAAFEFDLGLSKRAPLFMQKAGLEWLWRLLGNPRVLGKRYLIDDPYFLILLAREMWNTARGRERHSRRSS